MGRAVFWTRKKPTHSGRYWYRETPTDNPVSLEVFTEWGHLYTTPPNHVSPVPISEIDGEWSEDILGPPTG